MVVGGRHLCAPGAQRNESEGGTIALAYRIELGDRMRNELGGAQTADRAPGGRTGVETMGVGGPTGRGHRLCGPEFQELGG